MRNQVVQSGEPHAPEPAPPSMRGVIQRACDCSHKHRHHGGGECAACAKKRRLQRASAPPSSSAAAAPGARAPASVHQVLRSAGQPLDAGTRASMESRFGHDFARVRVHVGSDADVSARAIGALAYTYGPHIVFRDGYGRPHSDHGRALMAHELTHVVQQRAMPPAPPHDLRIDAPDTPHEREAERAAAAPAFSAADGSSRASADGRVQRACGPQAIGKPGACTALQGDMTGERFLFEVNCDDFRPAEEARLRSFAATIADGETIEIHGFASIDGKEEFNEHLSCARATKAMAVIQDVLTTNGVHATLTLMKHGANPGTAAEQRAVVLDRSGVAPPPPAPTPTPPATPPAFLCGPDVTTQVQDAITKTRSTFAGWSAANKESACDALDSLTTGGMAWDIVELHNQAWILTYRPACATAGATPPCGSTVKVGAECYYAGSPNYVIYGVMCKLCHDFFNAAGRASDAARFTQAKMEYWINIYKGTGWHGFDTPSANYGPSRDWAIAGYNGWPGATAPGGDRPGCSPTCPTPYGGSAFSVRWHPHGAF